MISSLLEKKKRIINLDRVMVTSNQGRNELLTDPDEVKTATINHFQNVAGSTHHIIEPDNPEWEKWSQEYDPIDEINDRIYDKLMDPPSKNEWSDILHNLPNNKASSISGISNEMLKHIGQSTFHYLWLLIGACLKLNNIPQQWKQAYVYPIPKPKEWHYSLANTRPITLLDTVRKALVKLINNRLMETFVRHKILKGLNFAGLPHKSTAEPLCLLDNILQDAKDYNKELLIYSKDMSKAYDRVNIYMLQKAMNRLKLPLSFITFITNLFTNRKNRVFTAHGTTNSYNLLVGIDQGEVISPLLWCIYYDPLLTKLQHMAEQGLVGYQMSHTWNHDLTNLSTPKHESCTIPLTAFMDDSHWINDSTPKLQTKLTITTSYNTLNSIQTNNDKAVLLSTKAAKRTENCEPITLTVGSEIINITPLPLNDSTRILGVWLTAGKSNQHIIKQIREEIVSCCALLKHKIITDKQILYIYNTVIIPRIEFRSQLVFLSKDQCDNIQACFRSLLKHKLRMPKNTPNAILKNNLIYNFRDLYENQIQAKYTSLFAILNDSSIVGISTHIRLLKLQTSRWLPNNPLICWPSNTSVSNKDHIADLLSAIPEYNLSFQLEPQKMNLIKGGSIPLINILDRVSYKNAISSLRFNNIMYLDQITSLDGDFLLKWIDTRLYEKLTSIKIPKWFQILESLVITDQFSSRRLKPNWITKPKPPGNYDSLTLVRNARPREWIAAWNPTLNDAVYGQVCKTLGDEIVFAHWKNDFSLQQTSPSHQTLFLKKCSGCLLDDPSIIEINKYTSTSHPACTTTCRQSDALYVPTVVADKTGSK